jgi:uroporphyrinogen-III synthase
MNTALPLSDRTVVVTRAAEQAGPFVSQLQALGATVLEVPLIRITDPADGGAALQAAVDRMYTYDWVVLTSPNAAARFLSAVEDVSKVPELAVVGPGTATVVFEYGFSVSLLADRSVGEGLVDAFPVGNGRVLIPRSAIARDVVPDGLRSKGWTVDTVDAYRTEPTQGDPALLPSLRSADAIAFTSSSTARAFLAWYGVAGLAEAVISIGPETTRTLRDAGVDVARTADPYTLDGLVTAVVATVGRDNNSSK